MTRKVRTVTTGLLGLAVLLVLLAGASLLTASGTTVRGTITGFGWNGGDGCYPTTSYTVDGATYRTTPSTDFRWCDLARRKHARVYYDPEHPADGRLDRYGDAPARLGAGAVVAIALAGLTVLAGRRSVRASAPPPVRPGAVPLSAGVLALSCLAAEAVTIADRGTKTSGETGIVVSMALGALLVGWFSLGVLRARSVRTTLVALLLAVSLLVTIAALLEAATPSEVVVAIGGIALAAVPLAALGWYTTTDWHRWQRLHPGSPAPSATSLVLVAALVGVLGGLTPPAEQGSPFRVEIRL